MGTGSGVEAKYSARNDVVISFPSGERFASKKGDIRIPVCSQGRGVQHVEACPTLESLELHFHPRPST